MKTMQIGWLLLSGSIAIAQVPKPGPILTLKEEKFNFDTLECGANCTHTFEFTNTGDEPLILTRVNTSCGCDMAEGPREPILPGKSGIIKYHYDSHRIGPINRHITITGNFTEGNKVIQIKGYIKPQPKTVSGQNQSVQGLKLGINFSALSVNNWQSLSNNPLPIRQPKYKRKRLTYKEKKASKGCDMPMY